MLPIEFATREECEAFIATIPAGAPSPTAAEMLDACHPGCGWNGKVVLDNGRWTCPRCGQDHQWRDH